MRLASFRTAQGASYGAVTNQGIVDLGRRLGNRYSDLRTLLERNGLEEARKAAGAAADYKESDVTWLPVIPNPDKIICVGLNYEEHRQETGRDKTEQPALFLRLAESQVGHRQPILRPRGEKTLDWEVELGVVIGKTARFVPKERALDYIYGYTIINDASARDFQFHTSQWGPGKMGDTLAPVGPYIADRSEIPDPHVLEVKTWVNGTLMQNGNTKNFIFDLGYIIQYLTNIMTLSPGDLISTGTPAGVGPLAPGDVVEVEIPGVGVLRNPVAREAR